ncbi:MAG: hypothetical protein ACJ71S_01315, partial [Acidobacteriaceae bacterium]
TGQPSIAGTAMSRALLAVLILCATSLPAQKPEATMPDTPQSPDTPQPMDMPQSLPHTSNSFALTVNASMCEAGPLFGPEGERVWAGDDWNPQFVFPIPARDVEGAVFTIRHGEHSAVWVNTHFDVEAGRMQYVYVLGDLLVTTIDVRLHAIDPAHTKVEVTYIRTALRPEAGEHVIAMGKHDREQGPVWERKINTYLQRRTLRR